jgi:hypothetical protein
MPKQPSIIPKIVSLLGDDSIVDEQFARELLLELDAAEVLRKSTFNASYALAKKLQVDMPPASALNKRCILALAYLNLADDEPTGPRFETKLAEFYEIVQSHVAELDDPRVTEAFARILVEFKMLAAIYYFQDKMEAGDEKGAAVDLRDAIQRLLPPLGDEGDDVLHAELSVRVDTLRATFKHFQRAVLDLEKFGAFEAEHLTTTQDVFRSARHLVRFIQTKQFGPSRLLATMRALEHGPDQAAAAAQLRKPKGVFDAAALDEAAESLGLTHAIKLRESSKDFKQHIDDPLEAAVKAPKRQSVATLPPAPISPLKKSASVPGPASKKPRVARGAVASASEEEDMPKAAAASILGNIKKSAARSPATTAGRVRFSEQEVAALIKGVKKHGKSSWALILEEQGKVFSSVKPRTTVDLKDKYRNLVKSGAVREDEDGLIVDHA